MLIIPSILVVVGMAVVGTRRRAGWEQRRLLFLLAATALSLGLLDVLILTNPYGREDVPQLNQHAGDAAGDGRAVDDPAGAGGSSETHVV